MQRIEKQVDISAPRSAVWDALTNPVALTQWMGVPEMRLEIISDWRVGSPIVIVGFHHATFRSTGTILRFEPEQTLCYTQKDSISRLPDEPQSYSHLCFVLAPSTTGTSLTITIDNFPTETIYKHLDFYWNTTINLLKRHIEQRQPAENS